VIYRSLFIGFISPISILAVGDAAAWEEYVVGKSVNVACQEVSVHERPSGSARKSNTLSYGERVKVVSLDGKFELSVTDSSSKVQLEAVRNQDSPPLFEDQYTRASWVGIERGGYVAASCLMPDYLFEGASEEELLKKEREKVEKLQLSSAQKNFSEEEKGDAVAMKGLAGDVQMGAPNYKAIDQYIEKSQGLVSHDTIEEFRMSGGLKK
jgi:hypothetical protein